MSDPRAIILEPVVTEKSTSLIEENKYVFRVAMKANKLTIGKAIHELFGVRPENVNIVRVRGKNRRLRYRTGKRSAWKTAIVTLRPGDKIDVFESK